MPFGQLVFGHPGAGKTTYCKAAKDFLTAFGRHTAIVNLDPANDSLPYRCEVDIRDLCDHTEAMRAESLGPNGAFVYCIEYLVENGDWLEAKLQETGPTTYLVFDCPGQVELYTHHEAFRKLVGWLQSALHVRLCGVHLVDSIHVRSGPQFMSALVLSLVSMLQLELPHINVLTKVDLLQTYDMDFNLDYLVESGDLSQLTAATSEGPQGVPERYRKLTEALSELVEDFPHVSFSTLAVDDAEKMRSLLELVDTANGYSLLPLKHPDEAKAESRLHRTAEEAIEGSYVDGFADLQRARGGA
eukprot:TRINITY_DN17567_c0_g3_i1.p1 TRINITY_DN17567_c0_g3~~TRINITY_DN17567_c0_g3_i1.p1  ORF type:complete len:301 (+),score=89.38 TRINITY_DN17567_c0_g3_i1:285-1187(+)